MILLMYIVATHMTPLTYVNCSHRCDTLLICIVATGVKLPTYCLGPKGLLTPEKFTKIFSHEAFPHHDSVPHHIRLFPYIILELGSRVIYWLLSTGPQYLVAICALFSV